MVEEADDEGLFWDGRYANMEVNQLGLGNCRVCYTNGFCCNATGKGFALTEIAHELGIRPRSWSQHCEAGRGHQFRIGTIGVPHCLQIGSYSGNDGVAGFDDPPRPGWRIRESDCLWSFYDSSHANRSYFQVVECIVGICVFRKHGLIHDQPALDSACFPMRRHLPQPGNATLPIGGIRSERLHLNALRCKSASSAPCGCCAASEIHRCGGHHHPNVSIN